MRMVRAGKHLINLDFVRFVRRTEDGDAFLGWGKGEYQTYDLTKAEYRELLDRIQDIQKLESTPADSGIARLVELLESDRAIHAHNMREEEEARSTIHRRYTEQKEIVADHLVSVEKALKELALAPPTVNVEKAMEILGWKVEEPDEEAV